MLTLAFVANLGYVYVAVLFAGYVEFYADNLHPDPRTLVLMFPLLLLAW